MFFLVSVVRRLFKALCDLAWDATGTMEYQLVMQLPVSEKTDFDRLLDLEGKLIIGMGDPHLVDGHDLGGWRNEYFRSHLRPNCGVLKGQRACLIR